MGGMDDDWFVQQSINPQIQSVIGEVAEWSIAAVLKTASG
jgi:hypothetical protein